MVRLIGALHIYLLQLARDYYFINPKIDSLHIKILNYLERTILGPLKLFILKNQLLSNVPSE